MCGVLAQTAQSSPNERTGRGGVGPKNRNPDPPRRVVGDFLEPRQNSHSAAPGLSGAFMARPPLVWRAVFSASKKI